MSKGTKKELQPGKGNRVAETTGYSRGVNSLRVRSMRYAAAFTVSGCLKPGATLPPPSQTVCWGSAGKKQEGAKSQGNDMGQEEMSWSLCNAKDGVRSPHIVRRGRGSYMQSAGAWGVLKGGSTSCRLAKKENRTTPGGRRLRPLRERDKSESCRVQP